MKTIFSILVLSSSLALAQTSPAPSGSADKHPCQSIKQACESAGFTKGGHKNGDKGLYVDCMSKIMQGQSVPGVTVNSADIAACKEKKAAHGK